MHERTLHAEGTLAAFVTSGGGWLERETRRLVAVPPGLLAVMRALDRSDDFAALPSSLR
jgi:acyl-CoA thioester hydrolase